MTEDLRDLLDERAGRADLRALDIAGIVAAGRRRTRRHRAIALGAAALAVVVVAGGSVALAANRGSGGNVVEPAARVGQAIPTTGITWATGSRLHVGDRSYDLGRDIEAYVRTAAGYVFADPSGAVWSAASGTLQQVGTVGDSEDPRLVGDATGPLAGWVEGAGPRPTFVVLDQATGETDRSTAARGTTAQGPASAVLEAIDGRTVYWRDGGGHSSVQELTRTSQGWSRGPTLANSQASADEQVLDAAGDLQMLSTRGGTVFFRRPGQPTFALGVANDGAVLSPDGTYAAITADGADPAVYDVASSAGTPIPLGVQAYFAEGYDWLDDDTLAVVARPTSTSDYELLTCTVPDGTCAVAVPHLGMLHDEDSDTASGFTLFTLPTGTSDHG